MKAIIGRTIGAAGMGAVLLLAAGCRESSSVASAQTVPAGTIVNCGEGRQAVVHPMTAGATASQVECVAIAGATNLASAPETAAPAPERVVVREKVVYRNAPAHRARVQSARNEEPVERTSSDEPVYRSPGAEPVSYPDRGGYDPSQRTSTPASYPSRGSRGPAVEPVSAPDRSGYPDQSSRYPDEVPQKQPRSWGKTAIIIGGATAGGAGIGAILGGGSGAKKGAILGAVAGTIYGVATRNK